MDIFSRLSAPIRRYIYEEGWTELRPIQKAAIRMATESQDNFILAARTAAGKTEAAFLPAISLVAPENWHEGVRILMISPLVALINDQFQRITRLCEAMDIPVTAWHGEANPTAKHHLLQKPAGIVLMTPESLEAMLDTHPERIAPLFSHLEWILTDELHSFLTGARGIQLRSLLCRLARRIATKPRYIGMSATLVKENFSEAKAFFPPGRETRILLDPKDPPLAVTVDFPLDAGGESEKASALYDALYEELKHENLLIFPNSRHRVEEIAHALQERVCRDGLPVQVMAHHSSVEKVWRKEAEDWAKSGSSRFALCATSTMELGVDIGTVDAVCQVDAPFSASSLAQRLGRSGRGEHINEQTGEREIDCRRLHFHATDEQAFWQGIAAIQMVRENRLEPQTPLVAPYDVFVHQVLALILENTEMSWASLEQLSQWPVFSFLHVSDIDAILEDMLAHDWLERGEGENPTVILGVAGEKIATHHDFYAMFESEKNYAVFAGKERIGSIPFGPNRLPGTHFLLSAQVWEIDAVEEKTRRIYVHRAQGGKAPSFSGALSDVSKELRETMLSILFQPPEDLVDSPQAKHTWAHLRSEVREQRPLQWITTEEGEAIAVFAGSACERTLYLLLRAFSGKDRPSIFWNRVRGYLYGTEVRQALSQLRRSYAQEGDAVLRRLFSYLLAHEEELFHMLAPVKFHSLLPKEYQVRYVIQNQCVSTLKGWLY